MTDRSRYERVDDPAATRRGLPLAVWLTGSVVILVALVVILVMLAGGHDPSQFKHG